MRLFAKRMAEIKYFKPRIFLSASEHLLFVLLLFLIPLKLYPQASTAANKAAKKIEILNADEWLINDLVDKDLNRLLGNIKIKHNDVLMYCDSAYYYKVKNQVRAFSKVHIIQGDTLNLYGDYLFYDGTTEQAFVKGNVV